MNCEQWELILMDLARGLPPQDGHDEALRHVESCASCGSFLRRQRALTERLHAEPPQTAGSHLEGRVLGAYRAHHRARRYNSAARWLNVAAALALILSASLFLVRSRPLAPSRPAPAAAADDLRGFLPVPYRTASLDRGYVIRVTMPRTALVTLGMPVSAGTPEVVQADLLLADDGTAHAVRLVR